MQFIDLNKQYKVIEESLAMRFRDILEDSRFILGKEVFELEAVLADYVGVKHCVACGNGTDALQLALMAIGVGNGDAVFVPSFTFYATAEAVSLIGAVPVFVDISLETFNMDIEKLDDSIQGVLNEGALTPRAVIPVDLFGLPAEYDNIREIANKYGIMVIEDGAQGFGGRISANRACSFGDLSTTSFFPSKPLGCYGDGGAVFTQNDETAEIVRSLRVHGKGRDKYQNIRVGMNSRLDTLQAAVLLEKIKILDNELKLRNNLASFYSERLKDILIVPEPPQSKDKCYYSSWAQYSVLAKDEEERNRVINYLKGKGIPTMIYYSVPMHLQEVYRDLRKDYCSLSVSENVCRRIFSLPMHPYWEEDEAEYIVNSLLEIYA